MENSSKKWSKKVPVTIIDAELDKYSQDKRILAKLQEDKEWLAKVGMPDLYYEEQAKIKAEMEDLDPKKVSIGKVNNDLKKYKKAKWVLVKLAEAERILEESPLPDLYYERQAEIAAKYRYGDTIIDEELSVAHEPMREYNAPKQEEK